MKNKILIIVKEMGFASLDEVNLILNKCLESAQKKTLKKNIQELEEERALLRILPNENLLSCEGFISGPNLEVEEDFEIKKIIVSEFSMRNASIVNWELLSERLSEELLEKIANLKEEILNKYSPKKLEMRYFDLSLKYHELYRFFYEKFNENTLNRVKEKLEECKSYLDKLEY